MCYAVPLYLLMFSFIQALLEFADLCNTSDVDSVKAVLPFWPRLYNTYAIDIDFRVREAAQQAHRAIVMAVKRDIAPYLKHLMGTWFVSPFDSHTLAANIAKTSFQVRNSAFLFFFIVNSEIILTFSLLFQAAFSPSKRTEAIVFAQHEILHYIAHNILDETPESLASSK